MKRQTLIRPLATVALIAAGAALDHGLTSPASPPSAAAAGATAAATHQTVTGSAADAVAEHAFALASPAVVYVDSVGLGSGSGVICTTTLPTFFRCCMKWKASATFSAGKAVRGSALYVPAVKCSSNSARSWAIIPGRWR